MPDPLIFHGASDDTFGDFGRAGDDYDNCAIRIEPSSCSYSPQLVVDAPATAEVRCLTREAAARDS